ncbi:MAG: hypothetical protein VX130_02180 [Verrucomicrobiota bacterium]|nr:hypothetical protein [Verrucomicrobiota bacterium]
MSNYRTTPGHNHNIMEMMGICKAFKFRPAVLAKRNYLFGTRRTKGTRRDRGTLRTRLTLRTGRTLLTKTGLFTFGANLDSGTLGANLMDGALEASGALGAYLVEKAFETIGTGRTDGTLGTLGTPKAISAVVNNRQNLRTS